MTVLLVNGRARKAGCTYTARAVLAGTLRAEGIGPQVIQAGESSQQSVAALSGRLMGVPSLVVLSPVCCSSPSDQIIQSMRPII